MASIANEVLGPAGAVETLKNIASGRALNRRNFLAALGMGGAAAGAALASRSSSSRPSVVSATGPNQVDVLNFALNLEYLEATFYTFITTGADIPVATGLTQGSGAITNGLTAPIVFTGPNAAQITDLLNEIAYDELSHVIALRALLGANAIARPAININPTATTLNSFTALGIARLLEDVGATAYAGAAAFLSGANLTYAAQILAVEGFHAGALRLIELQNASIVSPETTATATFVGQSTSGSAVISNVYYNATVPLPGQSLVGPGFPGTTITALSGFPFTGTITSGSTTITGITVYGATATTNLAVGQTIVGPGIPANTTITAIVTAAPNSLTISAPATASATQTMSVLINQPITGTTTSGKNTITAVTINANLAPGQQITGSGIPTGTIITAISATSPYTLTINNNATASATVTLTVGVGSVTTAASAFGNFIADVYFAGDDPLDVPVYDPGTAALAAAGPTLGGGFFNTSGTGTVNVDAPTPTPAGFAFARTTSQVLALLYGGASIIHVPGGTTGGFFPSGVNGNINGV